MDTKRVPISRGFYIEFSNDGRAVNHGLPDDEVLAAVEDWLTKHLRHADHAFAEQWLQAKRKQAEEDRQTQFLRTQRQEINALVDRSISKGFSKEQEEWVRMRHS